MDLSARQTFSDEFFMTFAIRPTSNANAFGSLLNGQGTAQNRVLVYENRNTSIRIAGTSYNGFFTFFDEQLCNSVLFLLYAS